VARVAAATEQALKMLGKAGTLLRLSPINETALSKPDNGLAQGIITKMMQRAAPEQVKK